MANVITWVIVQHIDCVEIIHEVSGLVTDDVTAEILDVQTELVITAR